jgi:hypothetical protein
MTIYILSAIFIFGVTALYFYLFYPQQIMPVGEKIEIETPEPEKYHNDCLHPCIRFIEEGFAGHNWWMIQSPYYERNSKIENPILYFSDDKESPRNWQICCVVRDKPETGFNSDPVIFYENQKLWIFWRESQTPLCNSINAVSATVGISTTDGKNFSEPKVYLTEMNKDTDSEQCPILIRHGDKYLFYASHYQYRPTRKALGISIWEGTSIENPDFYLKTTSKLNTIFTCDKYKQLTIAKKTYFIPKPLRHDNWHFDLFEGDNKLFMVSVAEWGDNIMLGESKDFSNFRIKRKPLVNCHFSKQKYYYKPTGFYRDGILHIYYTARSLNDVKKNELFLTQKGCKI